MEKRRAQIPNRNGEIQEFGITEENGEITIDRALSIPAVADIPAEIDGKPVTAIGESCFFGQKEMQKITFPETLRSIGGSAFALCKGLRELYIPDGVTEIGVHAFRDCRGLRRVELPANLKVLRHGLFAFCYLSDNAEILLPEGLEVIEGGVFWSAGFFKLVIPASVREIGKGAFYFGPKVITCLPEDDSWFAAE